MNKYGTCMDWNKKAINSLGFSKRYKKYVHCSLNSLYLHRLDPGKQLENNSHIWAGISRPSEHWTYMHIGKEEFVSNKFSVLLSIDVFFL